MPVTSTSPADDIAETKCDVLWVIAEWPDGTWCDWEDRHEMTHMSDDYERHRVITFDGNGYYPLRTERMDK